MFDTLSVLKKGQRQHHKTMLERKKQPSIEQNQNSISIQKRAE